MIDCIKISVYNFRHTFNNYSYKKLLMNQIELKYIEHLLKNKYFKLIAN